MTDRDRLIELVDKAKEEYANDVTDHTETDYIVECLLNNGVIVPPCKVGDNVYFPWIYDGTSGIAILEVSSIRLFRQKINLVFYDDVQSDMPIPSGFFFDDFGKTVFLTKEEAEQKLKEWGK